MFIEKIKNICVLDVTGENYEQMSGFKPSVNTKRIPIALSNNSSPSTENSPNTNTFSGIHIKLFIQLITLYFVEQVMISFKYLESNFMKKIVIAA